MLANDAIGRGQEQCITDMTDITDDFEVFALRPGGQDVRAPTMAVITTSARMGQLT